MRDKHDIMSVSTSPPLKKTKVIVEVHDDEMEIDRKENLEKKNEQEDMEVDSIIKQLSRRMDEKVSAKAKKAEEEERLYHNKRKLKEIKDKEQEELEKEKLKQLAKQKKQKIKDERKRMRKKSTQPEKEVVNKITNIKAIPKNISHLVNEGDVIYVVPGDGSCAPSSASAFLFRDEVFGRQLKDKMNKFIAKHWERKYKYKTQCSENYPFTRKLGGGGEVSFTDPNKLLDYLNNSVEAVYMWSDSEDLAVISDMYQVNIKIITTKGAKDEHPRVNYIVPDEEMKEHAELKHAMFDEMVLFHEDDMHFNLIVSEDNDLVTKGSLSYRTNIGPFMNNVDKEDSIEKDLESNDKNNVNEKESMENENKLLRAQLKKLTEKVKVLESDYQNCEEELKDKTELVENLKIQVKSQEEILSLGVNVNEKRGITEKSCDKCSLKDNAEHHGKEQIDKEHTLGKGHNCNECEYEVSSINQLVKHIIKNHSADTFKTLQCIKCGCQYNSNTQITEHTKSEHEKEQNYESSTCSLKRDNKSQPKDTKDDENRCYKCSFRGIDENDLRNHLANIHVIEEEHNCSQCGFQGTSKMEIKNHIIKKHMINCTQCDFYCDNMKVFEAHKQWIHGKQDTFRCRICGENFESKPNLMKHRKAEHIKTVAYCKKKASGECFFSDTCWWNHDTQLEKERKAEGTGFKCYTCNETFNQKANMMIHKKEQHRHLVRSCNLFIDNKCPHSDSVCWYLHENNSIDKDFEVNDEIEQQETNQPVFQEVWANLKPPIESQEIKF